MPLLDRAFAPAARTFKIVFGGLLGPDRVGARQSLIALGISSLTATGAGVLLAALTGELQQLPGLLVLVPAAIGMRGNIFGALGSRLATTIHAGTFRISRRPSSVVGQNVIAVAVLTVVGAVGLGIMVPLVAPALGLTEVVGIAELVTISVVGAAMASLVVLALTLALAALTARRGWDLDNVNAPIISAAGDIVTLPALFVASWLVGVDALTPVVALGAVVACVFALAVSWRTKLDVCQAVLRESLPVLLGTGLLLIVAGVVIEHRLATFAQHRAVLILVPACLASAGAIGGVLAGRLSTKLHLGVIEPTALPSRSARRDLAFGLSLAVPTFLLNGVLAHGVAVVAGLSSPGLAQVVATSLIGGLLATVLGGAVAYYGTAFATRAGADPDTLGIPFVTSTVDLGGAAALVLAMGWVGLT